jgi:hypothetical protein
MLRRILFKFNSCTNDYLTKIDALIHKLIKLVREPSLLGPKDSSTRERIVYTLLEVESEPAVYSNL